MESNKSVWGISGNTLKMIAIIAMFLDHIGSAILEQSFKTVQILDDKAMVSIGNILYSMEIIRFFDIILRNIGRIAFPIFCFTLVEGFFHTRNVKKYLIRLFFLAVVSEVPFDMAFRNTFLEWNYQNVFVTLFLGLLALTLLGFIQRKLQNEIVKVMLEVIVSTFFIAAAELLRSDYGGIGVTIILMIYFLHEKKKILYSILTIGALTYFILSSLVPSERLVIACFITICGIAIMMILLIWPTFNEDMFYMGEGQNRRIIIAVCTFLTFTSISNHFFGVSSVIAVLPVSSYNGERGFKGKWFFYLFYPVHLLLLAIIAHSLGLNSWQ